MQCCHFSDWHNETPCRLSKESLAVRDELGSSFLAPYLANDGFHDFCIQQIDLSEPAACILRIYKRKPNSFRPGKPAFTLRYKGFRECRVRDWSSDEHPSLQMGKELEWGYDEFSREGEYCCHSILTSSGKEITILFQTVEIS